MRSGARRQNEPGVRRRMQANPPPFRTLPKPQEFEQAISNAWMRLPHHFGDDAKRNSSISGSRCVTQSLFRILKRKRQLTEGPSDTKQHEHEQPQYKRPPN